MDIHQHAESRLFYQIYGGEKFYFLKAYDYLTKGFIYLRLDTLFHYDEKAFNCLCPSPINIDVQEAEISTQNLKILQGGNVVVKIEKHKVISVSSSSVFAIAEHLLLEDFPKSISKIKIKVKNKK